MRSEKWFLFPRLKTVKIGDNIMTKKYVYKDLSRDIEYEKEFLVAFIEGVNGFSYLKLIRIADFERNHLLKYIQLMHGGGYYDNGVAKGEVRCTHLVIYREGKQQKEIKLSPKERHKLGLDFSAEKEVA